MTYRAGEIEGLLVAEFDLVRGASVGQRTQFRYNDTYLTLGEGGDSARQENVSSFLEEEVIGVSEDGAAKCRWTRKRTESQVTMDGAVEGPTRFEFGEGFAYEGTVEEDFALFPVDTSTFPSSLEGFLMFESILHSTLFWMFTSRTHGGIEKLRKVGDVVLMPLSGRRISLEFRGFISITMERGDSVGAFEGLGLQAGNPVALLSYACPQALTAIMGGRGKGDLTARVWLDLNDGQILRGELKQVNYLTLPLGPDGQGVALNQVVVGELLQIPESEYLKATS